MRYTSANVMDEQGDRIELRDRRDFAKAINLLNAVMERVRAYEPEADYFVTPDAFKLMLGDCDTRVAAPQDHIALHGPVQHLDCGDW